MLTLAESRESGRVRTVAQFLAASYNGTSFKFDLLDLRGHDVEISDDKLSALDALRWGKADLYRLVPDGENRVQAIIALWGLRPAD